VTLVDPSPEMKKRLDDILKFDEMDHNVFVANHRAAAERLRGEGKVEIADLHDNYVNAVIAKDAHAQVDAAKALAALSKEDYADFLAKGFAFEDQSASGEYSYHGLGEVHLFGSRLSSYHEILVQSSEVGITSTKGTWELTEKVKFANAKQARVVQMVGFYPDGYQAANAMLIQAINANDVKVAEAALIAGATYSKHDLVIAAVKAGSPRLLSIALDAGGSANPLGLHDADALGHAILGDDPEMVSLLLSGGATANKTYGADVSPTVFRGSSPLGLAFGAATPNNKIIDCLLAEKLVEVNQPDVTGKTPLARAIDVRDAQRVKQLIRKGAKTDFVLYPPAVESGSNRRGALDVISYDDLNSSDIDTQLTVAALLSNGKANYSNWHDVATGRSFKQSLDNTSNFLVLAALENRTGDPDYPNDVGMAMKEMVRDGDPEKGLAVLFALQQAGFKINAKISDGGDTWLLRAIDEDWNTETIRNLLACGADPNSRVSGISPLHAAVKGGKAAAIRVLLEAGAKRDMKDDSNKLPSDYLTDSTPVEVRDALR
jgi:ankyrin repeat protein